MSQKDKMVFLKYFIRTYIPPFTKSPPSTEEEYEKIYISSDEMWADHVFPMINRIPCPTDIKKNMIDLFDLAGEIWHTHIVTCRKMNYNTLMNQSEIREKWRKMERLAIKIENYYKFDPELAQL